MLAKSVASIPPEASYEPKWDGFRSICFRDGDQVELGSRKERPMTRYFPELVAAAKTELPERCVVDGEIVIATDHGLDFEALQQRIHPADSRVRMLAEKTPASSSPSTYSLWATTISPVDRSASAAPPWSTRWPAPVPRSTSPRPPPTCQRPSGGLRSSRAQAWTE